MSDITKGQKDNLDNLIQRMVKSVEDEDELELSLEHSEKYVKETYGFDNMYSYGSVLRVRLSEHDILIHVHVNTDNSITVRNKGKMDEQHILDTKWLKKKVALEADTDFINIWSGPKQQQNKKDK